ncbi:MAG: FAD-dependent oxidoreductase [Verrucomicrobia bacterium]|nr:MAG: FAD-dependent oxidoreductase [Verrucomicrobiota bacterium]
MKNTEALLVEAGRLLEKQQNDQAINLLRSRESLNHPQLCALLARAYYQRGDSRGDVFSCHFFAQRSLELGNTDPQMMAICGVAAFRKELFVEAVGWFARYITEQSPPASQYLRGLALLHAGCAAEAVPWLQRAAAGDAASTTYQLTLQQAEAIQQGTAPALPPRMWEKAKERLGGVNDVRLLNEPAPYSSNAVSVLRGVGTQRKDLDWLGRNIPCQKACPAGTDIPEYLSAIYRGEYERAYRINLRDNVFPGVLGRVCARPCESACRHGWEGLGESVAICSSKRAAADLRQQAPVMLEPWFPASGKKVAVVGAGVAGLATARNLALLGHAVTVYEKHVRPGGMMNQGIPEFRLPRDVIEREIEQVRRLGVQIVCNTAIGRDITLAQLVKDFDAVVLAAGTLHPNMLNIPGHDFKGIRHGLDFLLEVNETRTTEVGANVLVIGGGFTAMDCARTAARLGAKTVELELETNRRGEPAVMKLKGESVKVLYRRSQTEMLITPGELEELGHEGIPMHFMVSPVAYVGENGRVRAMRFVRTELGEPDSSGRRRPVEIPGSEFEIPTDTVLLATGQFPQTVWIDAEFQDALVGPDGWLKSGKSPATAHPKIFVAGDYATGASSLINAIAHGKQCAEVVDLKLTGQRRLQTVAVVEDVTATGRIREMDFVARQKMPALPLEQRTLTAEVERGYSPSLATDETQRCYLCHYKFEIDPDKCIYCDWCIKAKPRPECIVKISSLTHDAQGRIVGYQKARGTEDTQLIWINQEDCIRCGACVEACPVDAISIQKVNRRTIPIAAK